VEQFDDTTILVLTVDWSTNLGPIDGPRRSYPATSDGRSTSVGSQAIIRFVRPFCYQNFPDAALPAELQNANPLGITRMVNGKLTKDEVV